MGNVFNRYGAGGGKSEGLYIWKKSEYIPSKDIVNPSFTLALGYSAYITNANFDLSLVPLFDGIPSKTASGSSKIVADFFEGIAGDNSNHSNFYIDYSNNALRFDVNGMTKVDVRGYFYEASTNKYYVALGGNTSGTLNMSYNGTKTIPAKIGDMVGYVVSDKEDAYPDKEVNGGFYYERVVLSPSAFGCTKYEIGKIHNAMSSNSLVINHSLGVLPKFAYVWQTDMTTGLSAGVYAFNPNATNEIHWATLAGNYISPYSGSTSAYEENANKVVFLGYTTSSAKFTVADYHYILFA